MDTVFFDIEVDAGILDYEVRAYTYRTTQYELVDFRNGKGALPLAPGLYTIIILLWGSVGSSATLKVVTNIDVDTISASIKEGQTGTGDGEIIVGSLAAFRGQTGGEQA